MLILMFLAQATGAPVATPPKVEAEPVIVSCPAGPTMIPPFGESCAAKQQVARVSEIILANDIKPVEAQEADGKDAKTETPEPAPTQTPVSQPKPAS